MRKVKRLAPGVALLLVLAGCQDKHYQPMNCHATARFENGEELEFKWISHGDGTCWLSDGGFPDYYQKDPPK